MLPLLAVDGVECETEGVRTPVTTDDILPFPLGSLELENNKSGFVNDNDNDALKRQLDILVSWLNKYPRPPVSSIEEEMVEAGKPQSLEAAEETGSAISDATWTSLLCEVNESNSSEGACTPDTSYEIEEPTWEPHYLVEADDAAGYGEIPSEYMMNPEKYNNQYFEIKKSLLGGNGAFAKTDLKQGQLILVERPMLVASPMTLYQELDKLAPEIREVFDRMHGYKRSEAHDERQAIFLTNAFCVGGVSCIYSVAARFNHACKPVSSIQYHVTGGRVMEFRVKRDVPAGTELTVTYGQLAPLDLYAMWGFRCSCGVCKPLTDEEVAKIDGDW